MARHSSIRTSTAFSLALAALGCGAPFSEEYAAEELHESGAASQPLVGGPLTSEATRKQLGLIELASPTGACSGALLNDFWVITAKHCVVDAVTGTPFQPAQVAITSTWGVPRTAPAARIVTFANDLALVMSSTYDFERLVGNLTLARQQRPATGSRLHNYGRGLNIFATGSGPTATPATSDGAYRDAEFTFGSPTADTYSYTPLQGAMMASGDSGGPSFIWTVNTARAEWQLLGVHANSTKHCLEGHEACETDPLEQQWATAMRRGTAAAIWPHLAQIEATIEARPTRPAASGQFTSAPPLDTVFLYGIQADDNGWVHWYRNDAKPTPRPAAGTLSSTTAGLFKPVSREWKGPRVVHYDWDQYTDVIGAGGNRFYARHPDGSLYWYQHTDFNDGSARWSGPVRVGTGWQSFARVFSGGNGVIYAITPDGRLLWYRHLGFENGTSAWAQQTEIGSAWNQFTNVFSTGKGVIYAVRPDGTLVWYRHRGVDSGAALWDGPVAIDSNWNTFSKAFAAGDGYLFGVRADGGMVRYRHPTWNAARATASLEGPLSLGSGWQVFDSIFTLAPMDLPGPR